jgi:hypothetical protein
MLWRHRKRREQDLERELRSDLELEADEQRENGLSAEDAPYAARRAFGHSFGLFWDAARPGSHPSARSSASGYPTAAADPCGYAGSSLYSGANWSLRHSLWNDSCMERFPFRSNRISEGGRKICVRLNPPA